MVELVRILLLGAVLLLPATSRAAERCTDWDDFLRTGRAIREALLCQERGGGHRKAWACRPRPVPACGREAVDAVAELLPAVDLRTKGGRVRFLAGRSLGCQRALASASRRFVARRVKGRLAGRRDAPLQPFLDRVQDACRDVPVVRTRQGRLPAVGGACAPVLSGRRVDADRLARCVSSRLDAVLDDLSPVPQPPNFVVILTDDQRFDTLDVMPQLRRELVDRGVLFHNAFVPTTACCPSRASLFTGQYAHNHGILTNEGLFFPEFDYDHEDILPAWLRAAGYATGLFGKYLNYAHVLGETKPDAWTTWQIFTSRTDRYFEVEYNVDGVFTVGGAEEADYSTDHLARATARFIREHRDRPFFAMYAPFAPHEPATPAPRHVGALAHRPPYRPPNFRSDVSRRPAWLRFYRSLAPPEDDAHDALIQKQLESLLAVDDAVGALSRLLDELGLTDNTVVLFLSDNGMQWGSHWWFAKWTPYEESLRIPFVMRDPARHPLPRESDEMVLNLDVAPTLMARAGLPMPPANGRDLAPVLEGREPGRDDFLIESFTTFFVSPHEGVRTRRYKYVLTKGNSVELYDLAVDPWELDNRAGDPAYAEVEAELAARLAELRSVPPGVSE